MMTAAMYVRLSKEDTKQEDSNSIKNQQAYISKYAKQEGMAISHTYIDDGYSGASFNRPGFQLLLRDIEEKEVKTVLVKDLSRFGRDYIEVGRYVQRMFAAKRVRFISIADQYDTAKGTINDHYLMFPIKNFLNESYCRDISQKVRAAQSVRRKNAQYIGSVPPYGYKRDSTNKYKLVIDEQIAPIIQLIFQLKIEGYSSRAIAKKLDQLHVPTPYTYRTKQQKCWDTAQIIRILKHEVYIGSLIQGRYKKINFKSKALIELPREEWSIHEQCHEPIISKETFYLANVFANRDVMSHQKQPYLLTGLVYCSDCHCQMIRHERYQKRLHQTIAYFVCKYQIGHTGENYRIEEDVLIHYLKKELTRYQAYEHHLLKAIKDLQPSDIKADVTAIQTELSLLRKQKQKMKHDRQIGLLLASEYDMFLSRYEQKEQQLTETLTEQLQLEKELIAIISGDLSYKHTWFKFIDETKLSRYLLVSMVDKIMVRNHPYKPISVMYHNQKQLAFISTCLKQYRRYHG